MGISTDCSNQSNKNRRWIDIQCSLSLLTLLCPHSCTSTIFPCGPMAYHGPAYGLSAELKAKQASKYDQKLENEARAWIEAVTGQSIGPNFWDGLKSGVLLCEVVNRIRPGTIKKINRNNMPFMQMENIDNYIKACNVLGVPSEYQFLTVELYEQKNVNSVLENIHALGRTAQSIGFTGPKFGVKVTQGQVRALDPAKEAEARASLPKFEAASMTKPKVAATGTGSREGIRDPVSGARQDTHFQGYGTNTSSSTSDGGNAGVRKFCSSCGSKLNPGARFCGNCGSQV